MKTKLLILTSLALGLASGPTWAQDERKLVIEPALPHANEPIRISVSNSACFTTSEVRRPLHDEFQIRLTYLFEPSEQCLQETPDAPDFETTVGPLPTGTYRVGLLINYGGFGSDVADNRSFRVINAPPPAANMSDGGINGLYHDLQAPHRYLYVLETDYTTLVVWNTFDPEGNQLWVYGVGDLSNDGSTVVAETYINTSGGFLPNGEADDDVEPWGFIRVDLVSCLEGTVTYHSDLPEFGSGQFSIVRLANAKQVGCVDSE